MTGRHVGRAAPLLAVCAFALLVSVICGGVVAHASTTWNVTVYMTDDMVTRFDPNIFIIHTGDTVVWNYIGGGQEGPIVIQSDPGQAEEWTSYLMGAGHSYNHTFCIKGSYFYGVTGLSEIAGIIVDGATCEGTGNQTVPDNNQTVPDNGNNGTIEPTNATVLGGPAGTAAGGVAYLLFMACSILGAGGAMVSFATAVTGRATKDARYRRFDGESLRAAAGFTAVACLVLVLLMVANAFWTPTLFTTPFMTSVFGLPLYATAVLLSLAAALMWLGGRAKGSSSGRTGLLVRLAALASSVASVFVFGLVNSFSIAPNLPSGALVVVKAASLDPVKQLSLMLNPNWLPLSTKLLLVGGMSFAVVASGVAVVRRWHARTSQDYSSKDFDISWGFKLGIVFGAPLGALGYVNSAVMHSATPILANALMGKALSGVSAPLVTEISALWDVAIVSAMALAALAASFYLASGGRKSVPGDQSGVATRTLLPWVLVALAVAVMGVLYAGGIYPGQYLLGVGVLVGGFLTWEAVRRYSLGALRLWVPAGLFAASCYALILYMAPHTEWYLAKNFGGVSWPLLAFPALVVLATYAGVKSRRSWRLIPLIAAVAAPAIIIVKSMDVELMKGASVIAIDPAYRAVLLSWGYTSNQSLAAVTQAYYFPSGAEVIAVLAAACGCLLCLAYLLFRSRTHSMEPRTASLG